MSRSSQGLGTPPHLKEARKWEIPLVDVCWCHMGNFMTISIILGNKNGSSLLGKWWKKKIDGNFGDLGFRKLNLRPWKEHRFSPSFLPKSEVRPHSYHSDTIQVSDRFVFTEKPWNRFSKIKLTWYYGCFLKRLVPPKPPEKMIIFSRKTHSCWVPPLCECLTPPFSTFQITVCAVAATIRHPFFPRSAPFLQVGSSEWSRANSTKSCLKVKVTK